MQTVNWSQEMELGVPEMDDAHKALLEELTRLSNTPDDQFATGYFALIAALEQDFREEEQLMENIDFPALHSHREQHARVLSGLHHVVPDVMQGHIDPGREAIALFQQWFLFHLSTMDLALAVDLDLANVPKESISPLLTRTDLDSMVKNIMR